MIGITMNEDFNCAGNVLLFELGDRSTNVYYIIFHVLIESNTAKAIAKSHRHREGLATLKDTGDTTNSGADGERTVRKGAVRVGRGGCGSYTWSTPGREAGEAKGNG